jgi:hypothetical protein
LFAKGDGALAYRADKLRRDVYQQQCLFASQQALEEAEGLLRGHFDGEESLEGLNMELCWATADVYMRAILEAHEQDIESEAIARSRLGRLFRAVFKLEDKAHQHYLASVQLALSLR